MAETTALLRQHLYIALAFQTVLTTDKKFHASGASKKIVDLAQQISDFCNLNAPDIADMPIVHLVNEAGTEDIDAAIETFIRQRRSNEALMLPEHEEALFKLYDRLQHRAARRINRLLFAQITKEKLAQHVLSQIDQEIKEQGMMQ
jgi:acyl-CoA reductase-like NAD-dependent aldehyde dehydrogenase